MAAVTGAFWLFNPPNPKDEDVEEVIEGFSGAENGMEGTGADAAGVIPENRKAPVELILLLLLLLAGKGEEAVAEEGDAPKRPPAPPPPPLLFFLLERETVH